MTDSVATVPNHHAHYPGFSGFSGLTAALSMSVGRSDNARLAAELCRVGPHDAIVDIGCGPGAAARHAASLGATVTGVDPARVMRRVARLMTRSSKVRYVEGAAEALPVDRGAATIVWSIATVHHWRDIDAGLAKVRRVLRPGGRFLAIERATVAGAQGLASHGWTVEQADAFATRCTEYGFADVRAGRHAGGRSDVLSVLGTAE